MNKTIDQEVRYVSSRNDLLSVMRELMPIALLSIQNSEGKSNSEEVKPPATRDEACKFLGVSKPTLDTLLKTGQIPHFRIGYLVRINWIDLHNYINQKSA